MALKISGTNVIDDSLVAVLDATYVKTMTVAELAPYAMGAVSGYTAGGSGNNTIDKFPFSSPFVTATDAGDLSARANLVAGVSSDTDGFVLGGSPGFVPIRSAIDKFPFSTPFTTASTIGNLSEPTYGAAGSSSFSDGYRMGGYNSTVQTNTIEKFPFSTPFTTATDVGDLTIQMYYPGGHSSTTDGYTSGGATPPGATRATLINKFPFSTPFTTATNIGSLTIARQNLGGHTSSSSGYSSGGSGPAGYVNTIDKFPFTTPFTTATDIGDLSGQRGSNMAQSSEVNGYSSGGINPSFSALNTIDQFPFSTPFTTATDIGDLSQGRYSGAGLQD
jgi:hypothetical protein